MHGFHYKCIKKRLNANLLTQTVQFMQLKQKNVYEDILDEKTLSYCNDSPMLLDLANKNVIGKINNKFKEKKICEFVGLKLKMYSLADADSEQSKKVKGVSKNVVKDVTHKEFVDFLFNKGVMRYKMKGIQSKFHIIGTYDVHKMSLSCFDDTYTNKQMMSLIAWLIFVKT